jgi:hypothetical protein
MLSMCPTTHRMLPNLRRILAGQRGVDKCFETKGGLERRGKKTHWIVTCLDVHDERRQRIAYTYLQLHLLT